MLLQLAALVAFASLSPPEANPKHSAGYLLSLGEVLSWREASSPGSGRDKNRGLLYGGGARGRWNPYHDLTFSVTLEVVGNRFDRERVEFLMVKTRADLGWTFQVADGTSVGPYVSFGYRRWIRDLEGDNTRQVVGLTQTWRRHYGQLGVEVERSVSRVLKASLNAGVIAPLASRMKINDLGGTCRVNFDGVPSAFGEFELKYKRFLVGLFYEGQRFPQSRDRCFGSPQPESKADIFGLKTGFGF